MNNKYETFDCNRFCYYITSTFDNRHYLIPRYAPKAEWNYGDTVNITFNLYECDIDPTELETITTDDILVTFYNHKFEELPVEFTVEIIENEENEDNEEDETTSSSCTPCTPCTPPTPPTPIKQFIVSIDYNNSCKYFTRGTYYCSLRIPTYNENDEISTMVTILPANKCCFYVV